MQNYTKSQTRLAFVQYIFQSEFLSLDPKESLQEFQKYFYNSNISAIGEKNDFKLKFNKNFLNKLSDYYIKDLDKSKTINQLNKHITSNRKFEKWDIVLKSIIFAVISEIEVAEENKLRIILDDYINITKSLVSVKEVKLMNAIIQKYLDEKKFIK